MILTLWSVFWTEKSSVADPDHGSGMGEKAGSEFRIQTRDEQHRSYFWELRNQFLVLKY